MKERETNINAVWAELLVEELVRCGVRCVALSSGARSGTLVSAVARHEAIESIWHADERASAFFALGHARATGRPAVWLTTSGTAVANGMPAIVEACQDGVPLLLLTADRPPELRDVRANQAIDQVKLFGNYVRWFVDMPCPDRAIAPAYVLSTVDQAWARATHGFGGPVHINVMLREPLTPESDGTDYSSYLAPLASWRKGDRPHALLSEPTRVPASSVLSALQDRIGQANNGLLLVGRLASVEEREAVRTWSNKLPWPMIADITSGLRIDVACRHLIPFADQVLLDPHSSFAPDLIVQLGGPLVSKRIQQFIDQSEAERWLLKTHPHRQDPGLGGGALCEGNIADTLFNTDPADARTARDLADWQEASEKAGSIIKGWCAQTDQLSEIAVAHSCAEQLPDAWGLFLGSSMPIRDMDMYAPVSNAALSVSANRGASGIDGTIATACGWAKGRNQPVLMVAGDLAVLHDLNALHYCRTSNVPVILVVINNDGGGIFSFLPIARHQEVFEPCFGTPHGLQFAAAARMFDLPYEAPANMAAFRAALKAAIQEGRPALIEVGTARDRNWAEHQELQGSIRQALAGT